MLLRKAKVVDETHLELSEPIQADEGRTVVVSVSETPEADMERKEWCTVAASSLEKAYSDSEPEYSASMLKENNPEYPHE